MLASDVDCVFPERLGGPSWDSDANVIQIPAREVAEVVAHEAELDFNQITQCSGRELCADVFPEAQRGSFDSGADNREK